MAVVVVHDPRLVDTLPDGTVFTGPNDPPALERAGVVVLPFEEDENYVRSGWGAGVDFTPATGLACPFVIDVGVGDAPWLYWVAVVQLDPKVAASGFLSLTNDTSRSAGFRALGLGIVHAPQRIEAVEQRAWKATLRGKVKLGGQGPAGLAFSGTLTGARILVTAASVCRNEY